MGCDIHAAIEFRRNGHWEAIPLDLNRDYDMFAILANVRNGEGFAGCKTASGFRSISDGRGLPEDISETAREAAWGDHSDTWVMLDEILQYDWTEKVTHYGVVNSIEFEEWDRMKRWVPAPKSYCDDVVGANVTKIEVEEMRQYVRRTPREDLSRNVYCRISWNETTAESGAQIWRKVLPLMLKLSREVGNDNVRMVMNFDS